MAAHAEGGEPADAARRSADAVATVSAPVAADDAGSGPAFAAERVPSSVFVKVGDVGEYARFRRDWEDVSDMDADQLLNALQEENLYKLSLTGVTLNACTVAVVKPAAVGDEGEPIPALETDDNIIKLKLGKTVGFAANQIGESVHGARLFVHVHIPRE